ncbi:MAG: ribose-phosphate pyrophosphokinase [Polyangiaceae bacterium]|nr:ribose-phosphate pyrophosphokinase [Polyangiaceae bacterium]
MSILIASGGSHPALAQSLAAELGHALFPIAIARFPDGEMRAKVEGDARGADVFVVQPTHAPVGERALELLLVSDALRRAGASDVTAVVPYLGLSRQERCLDPATSLGARVLADMLSTAGFRQIISIDLHAPALEGFFGMPVLHVSALGQLAVSLRQHLVANSVVVAPDLGAAKIAQRLGAMLGLRVALVRKIRRTAWDVEDIELLGDVSGCVPVIVDDMISTGGTIAAALETLRAHGAHDGATVAATHGLFTEETATRLLKGGARRIIVTDTVPQPWSPSMPIDVVSVAPVLVEAIRRIGRQSR